MSFLLLVLAFLLQQFRSATAPISWLARQFTKVARWVQTKTDDGSFKTGRFIWWLLMSTVLTPLAIVLVFADQFSPLLYWLVELAVFFALFRTREMWHQMAAVQQAFQGGEAAAIEAQLDRLGIRVPNDKAVNLLIEKATRRLVQLAHQEVFGVFFYLMIPMLGPILGLGYFLAQILATHWHACEANAKGRFHWYAIRAYAVLDYLPQRCSAILFSLVGNFELAFVNWRHYRQQKASRGGSFLEVFGIGALGIELANTAAVDYESGEAYDDLQPDENWTVAVLTSLNGLLLRTFAMYWIVAVVIYFTFN